MARNLKKVLQLIQCQLLLTYYICDELELFSLTLMTSQNFSPNFTLFLLHREMVLTESGSSKIVIVMSERAEPSGMMGSHRADEPQCTRDGHREHEYSGAEGGASGHGCGTARWWDSALVGRRVGGKALASWVMIILPSNFCGPNSKLGF
ncbi:LADA_0F01486g1_1 [Lachancea dasiensis]|uniref:LADA_0F01486g1_1 n=1 Tax=Lachancea dasiensis TaxID=1072105 RepID=A0A1G4JI15_9SACH|nr:LADA_0F01486g1_1 [Lachancea dasiensis]